MKGYKRNLFIIGGTLAVGSGIAGIFIPVLPTTPFLLLAAYCYSRSSKKLYNKLLTNKLTGKYISNYINGRGVSMKHKIISLSFLWLVIVLTIIFGVDSYIVRSLLLVIAIGVTIHIAGKKTARK